MPQLPPFDRAAGLTQIGQALTELITAVDLCMRDQLYLPTLILLFSGIDIAGWSAAEDPAMKVKGSFMAWVDKYLNPVDTLGCTTLELYGARCAVVHTLTTESKLYEDGHVRKVVYAWFPTDVEILRRMNAIGVPGYVAVQGDHLAQAYKAGLARFMEDLKEVPESHLAPMAIKLLGSMSTGEAEALVKQARGLGLNL